MAPTEDEMRTQMFKTMEALGRMADAVTDHLTADKQPGEQTPGPDYSSLVAVCKVCEGFVVFEDYERKPYFPNDTCTCDPVSLDNISLPPNVKAIYAAIHAARDCPPIVACPRCKRPSVVNDPTKLCSSCLRSAQNKNWRNADNAEYFFKGDVVVEGDLLVKGDQTVVNSKTIEDCPQFDEIRKQLAAHQKALAIIGVFGGFENVSFGQTEPGRLIRSLVRLSVCRECIGTGWIARDEQCRNCNRSGYQDA